MAKYPASVSYLKTYREVVVVVASQSPVQMEPARLKTRQTFWGPQEKKFTTKHHERHTSTSAILPTHARMSSKASLKAMARDAKSKKKSAKPKQVAQKTPPPTFKSSEFVADSSDEDEEEASDQDSSDNQPPAKPVVAKSKFNGIVAGHEGRSSSSSSGSGSESEKESEESEKSSDEEEEEDAARVSPATVTPSK